MACPVKNTEKDIPVDSKITNDDNHAWNPTSDGRLVYTSKKHVSQIGAQGNRAISATTVSLNGQELDVVFAILYHAVYPLGHLERNTESWGFGFTHKSTAQHPSSGSNHPIHIFALLRDRAYGYFVLRDVSGGDDFSSHHYPFSKARLGTLLTDSAAILLTLQVKGSNTTSTGPSSHPTDYTALTEQMIPRCRDLEHEATRTDGRQ